MCSNPLNLVSWLWCTESLACCPEEITDQRRWQVLFTSGCNTTLTTHSPSPATSLSQSDHWPPKSNNHWQEIHNSSQVRVSLKFYLLSYLILHCDSRWVHQHKSDLRLRAVPRLEELWVLAQTEKHHAANCDCKWGLHLTLAPHPRLLWEEETFSDGSEELWLIATVFSSLP